MNNERIIYVDETTFNLWQMPKKLWLSESHKEFTMQSNRGTSISLIGAIDNRVGLIYYTIFEGSNNVERFKEFMKGLMKTLKKDRAAIVLDNLPIHISH